MKKLFCKINKSSCRKNILFVHIIKDISDDNGSIIFNVLVNIIMSLCILKFAVSYFYIYNNTLHFLIDCQEKRQEQMLVHCLPTSSVHGHDSVKIIIKSNIPQLSFVTLCREICHRNYITFCFLASFPIYDSEVVQCYFFCQLATKP